MQLQRMSGFSNEGGVPIEGEIQVGDVVLEPNGSQYRWHPIPPHVPKPVTMTDKQFRQYVQVKLGPGVYGAAFKAASQSSDGAVLDAYAAWAKATTYDKSEVAAFTSALVAASILTSQQRASLVGNGNWPEA